MKYACKYYSGGGNEYDGGVWEKRETVKKIVFVLIEEPFFDINWNKLEIHKDETKNKRHCFRDWGDGTYTIYPEQCGKPYVFTPIRQVAE